MERCRSSSRFSSLQILYAACHRSHVDRGLEAAQPDDAGQVFLTDLEATRAQRRAPREGDPIGRDNSWPRHPGSRGIIRTDVDGSGSALTRENDCKAAWL